MRPRRHYDFNITFDEFKYYINEQKLLSKKDLEMIESKVKQKLEFYWTNKEYASHRIGFKFYTDTRLDSITNKNIDDNFVDLLELPFDFDIEDFNNMKKMIGPWFLTYEISKDDWYIIYNILLNNNGYNINKFTENKTTAIICKNHDEFVNELIKNDKYILLLQEKRYFDDFNNVLSFLFNTKIKEKYKIHNNNYYRNEDSCKHILKIIERRIDDKNYRIAVNKNMSNYYNNNYSISCVSEESPSYNYYDVNRVYIIDDNKEIFLPDDTAIIGSDNSISIDVGVCKLIHLNVKQILGPNENIINKHIYNFYARQVKRETFNDEKVTELEKQIITQYFKILGLNKAIKLDQVIISNNYIKTEDDMFKIEFDSAFFNLNERFVTLKREIEKGDAKYNFNALYELVLKQSVLKIIDKYNTTEWTYKKFESTKFVVNGMEITVKKDNNRIKINDCFCRIDDVQDILSKAICYTNINDFNKYIKDVSYIGLEWKKLISNGILLKLNNPLFRTLEKIGRKSEENIMLRFSLLWDDKHRQKVYLVVNGNKHLIKYKGKFIRYFDTPSKRVSISALKRILGDTLEEFKGDTVFEIVNNAIKEAKIITERGKELVKLTVNETKAKNVTITVTDGNKLGFEIIGIRTGTKYFIDKQSLNVYRWDNGKWNRRCVVSDPNKQRIFEDQLANRLINIYNENSKITTLFG